METIGEKSMFPRRKKPLLEKRFKYGSVMAEMILPNFVNFKPGIQLMMI
jgi:hypothetical protein